MTHNAPDTMTVQEFHDYQETGKLPPRLRKKTRMETIADVADKAPELVDAAVTPKRRNKYNAIPTVVDGHKFSSKIEARRYEHLKMLENAGEIANLVIEPRYVFNHNGVQITSYRPDFEYTRLSDGHKITEDVKARPTLTRDYKIRKKMMKAFYGIDVIEVREATA